MYNPLYGYFLGKPMPSTTFNHQSRRAQLQQRLKNAIKTKHIIRKEMKVGTPIDLHITSECDCCICLETLKPTNIAVPPCGHKYCFTCLMENAKVSRACPLCRETIVPELPRREMSDENFGEFIASNLVDAVDKMFEIEFQDNEKEEPATSESPAPDAQLDRYIQESQEGSQEGSQESSQESSQEGSEDDDEYVNELIEDIKERRPDFNKTHEELFRIMYETVNNACVDMCEFYEK